jgi:predicted 3-demethylubiquinone-9 3-methyltransferase (glyoxalase superfamily)
MPSITPSLWFDHNLEEAARFYASVFPNSHIESFNRATDAGPGEPGSVLSGSFVLDGNRFIGINGGPHFRFSEAVSFTISCKNQDDPEPAKATAATQAMYGMRKIVIADLEQAAAEASPEFTR